MIHFVVLYSMLSQSIPGPEKVKHDVSDVYGLPVNL